MGNSNSNNNVDYDNNNNNNQNKVLNNEYDLRPLDILKNLMYKPTDEKYEECDKDYYLRPLSVLKKPKWFSPT